MEKRLRFALIRSLRENADVFAWETADMPGLSSRVATHWIPTDPLEKPM